MTLAKTSSPTMSWRPHSMADMSVVASHASALWKRSEEMSLWDAFLMDEKSMRASLWSVTAQGAQLLLTIRPRGRHFSLLACDARRLCYK